MTNTRRLAPLPLMLIALAALAVLVLIPWVVQAQAQEVTPTRDATGDAPPAQPTTLQASAEHDAVTLTWTASTDQTVTHYAILGRDRDTDALGVFHVIDSNAGAETSYTDSSVAAASRYGYRVKAVSPTGVSQWSGFVKADTPAAPEPTPTPGLTPATLESTLLGYSEEEGAGTLEPNEVTFDEGATFRVTSVNTWPGVPGLVLMLTAGSSAQDAALADRDFILEADETVLVVGTTEFSFDDATLSHSDTTGDNAEYTGVVLATWTEGEPGLAAGETVAFRLERRDRPEEAQFTTHNTKRILVSNVAITTGDDDVDLGGNDHAQLFTTGANTGATAGWVLTSLIVVSEDTAGDDFDVEICEADDTTEFPTSTCTTLQQPSSFAAGNLKFKHRGIYLNANDNYVAVFKQIDTEDVKLDSTTSGGEDATGLTGWSIKNKFDLKSSGAWQQKSGGNEAIQITVNGYETPANQDATGPPIIFPSAEGVPILFAEASDIRDGNGLPLTDGSGAGGEIEFVYSYQWLRVDGVTATNIGVDSPRYRLVDADIGKLIKVEVSFTDLHNYSETVTSLPFGPVLRPAADPSLSPATLVSNTGQTNSATANITMQYAQEFTLGDHGQGYELSSVSIELAAVPTDLTVSLWIAEHADRDSTLESRLYDFKNPATFAVGANEFTAPPGVLLHQNIQYAIVLSGFTSLSIKETTSDAEDAGGEPGAELGDKARVRDLGETGRWGFTRERASSASDRETGVAPNTETPVLRLAIKGSKRSSGILASTYAQTASGDQEIISVGDVCCISVVVGSADRYLIRGFSWNSDDTTVLGAGVTHPWHLIEGSTKLFRLSLTRNISGVPEYSAPQGATVEGGSTKTYALSVDWDAYRHIGSGSRTGHILTRIHGTQSTNFDTPSTPGVTFSSRGDVAIPGLLMALLGEPLHAMVQNLGQADNTFHAVGGVVPVLSQGFTTSPNAAGYRLQGIGVNIEGSDSVVGVAQVPDDAASVSVAVYSADADGKPDAKLFDLLSPTEYAPGHSFFEAPAGTTLAASTSYVVVWSHLGGTWHRLQQTSSDSEDAGAFAGFSIADAFYRGANLANLAADSGGNALEIAVYGNAITPLKRVTGFDFHNSNSAAKGIWGNDDTFWVANDGTGAGNKLYAYNRSDGSRDTGSDFDNLNAAGNTDVRGICSDGTTMFVADSGDNMVYAYNMSDTTRDSSKDVTLDADNGSAHGLSCDSTHLWVADDTSSHLISKIFVYLRSDGSHASTLDIGAGTLSPSNTDGTINNHRPSGMWSNGTTLFVADHVDEKIYAYQLADRTRDDAKNLSLDTDNANPEGLWFDGRVLWVVDSSDVQLYAYDLPGAQPDNTAAAGVPTLDATAQQDIELTADISGITDSTDGLDNVLYLYQWIRVDGADETELAGETGSSYTPTADDVGKNLKVRVIFDDAAGNQEYPRYSPEIGPVNALTVPDAPTMLTAEPAPDTTPPLAFDLSWTAPASDGGSAITKHQYRQKTGSNALGAWTDIPDSAATEANATSYTVKGLTANTPPTTFTFEVQAVNANGDSGPSNHATATVDVPDQIATIGTTPSDGQIALIWDPPANNGSAILRYQYFVLNADTNIHLISRWTNIPGSNAATVAYTVTGLTNGVPYNFGVRPVNSVGPGPGKSRENLIPATFPTAPTNLMAEPRNGKVRLEWTAPTFNGGITINYYEYQQKAGTNAFGPWLRIIGSSASTTGYTVISLTNGTSYTFKVRARNDIDAGTASNEATATPANFPDPPPTVTATAGNQQITVNWTTPADNGNTILRYQYNVYDTTNEMTHTTWTNIAGSDVNTTEYTVTSLTNGVAYAIGIRAVNDFGPGPGTLSPVLIPASIPGAPTGLTAEPGDGQVHLQWTAPISDGGNTITGYEYQQKTGSTPFGSGINISGSNANTTEHTVTGLTNGTNYTFRVRAKNPMGEGLPSNEASATPVTVPSVPQNFTLTPGNGQVRLDWTAPASDGGNAILRYEYRHRAGTDSFTTWTNVLGSNINTTQYTVTGLTNGTLHTFEIRAATATTKGMAASETTTPMAVAPDAPRELSAKSKNTAVELTWQTPLDNGGSPIIRYEYRQKTGNGPFGTWMNIPNSGVTGLNATSYTVTGLTNGTSYHFKLRAVNNADESAASNEALGIPQPITTPDKPRGGQLSPGEGKVIVQWIEPLRDGGTPILHYEYCLRQKSQCNGHWVEIPDSAPGGDNHGLYEITRSNGTFTRVYLRAVNDQGAGHSFDYSAVPLAGAPAAPTNLRAEAPSSEYVKISWNEPRARSGATIIGYSLEYSRDGVTWARDPYCQFPYCDQQYLGHGRHPRGTNSIMTRIGEDATLYYRIRTLFHTNTPTIVNDIDFSRGASPSSPIITVTTVGATGILALPTIGVTGGHGREGANDVIVFDLWITGHQQRTTPVTVIYRTVDLRARAGSDYITRSGLLTFAPTDTEKTVSVPIIDDAVEDSGEEFILRLSNASGALIARAGAFGTITNTEESLTGFTLVNAATETDIGGVGDGDTVTLDDPADGQYGIRVETMPDTGVNSVRLELSGAKTVTRTDNEAPYTLYAEGGEGLPPGAYTLQVTAYPEAHRGGNALQSISVSFTVAEATEEPEDEPSLTATFPVSPFQSTGHRGGDDRPQVIATFSLPVKPFEKTTPSVSLTGATVRSVSQHQEEGLENAWIFFLDPEDNEDIVFTLAAGQSCDAGGICTQDGAMLYQGAATTLPGPQPEQEEQNTQATGVPTISGTPQVGETLTADTSGITDAEGLTNVSYRHQWTAGGSDISGATGSSYLLTSSEQGQTVQVKVTFTDDADNQESLTSAATLAVAARPNTPATGEPAISGTPQMDETLTAGTSAISDEDGLDNVSYRYQWLRDNADIAGQTSSTYLLASADEGKTIKVKVSFTDDANNQETLTSAATAAVAAKPNTPATGAPTINGTAQVGEILTANTSSIADADGLTNVSYNYQWIRNDDGADTNIARETASAYTLVTADQGKTIRVEVSFTDDANNEETLTSAATVAVAPQSDNTVADEAVPVWSADMLVVEYSSVSIGAASADLFSNVGGSAGLQVKSLWSYTLGRDLRLAFTDGVPGAEDMTLQVGDLALAFPAGSSGESRFKWNDVDVDWEDGQTISVRIVPTSATATVPPNTPATGLPTISGKAQVEETLTADTSGIADADGLTNVSYSYQWIRSDGNTNADIEDATDSTYEVSNDDLGQNIKVQVSFTDGAGNQESLTSEATVAVAAKPNSEPTGLPTISGTAQVGQKLTADTSGITDADGLTNVSYSYQWVSNDGNADTDIEDATTSTYEVSDGDVGNTIKVRVSFTDDRDNEEAVTSAATAVVAARPNTPATGLPTISGMAQASQTFTADTSGIDDEDGLTNVAYSYQWIRSDGGTDTDIDGATGSTYTLTDDEVGKAIKVKVSFTDDADNEESLTSAATASVAARPNNPATGAPTISGTAQAGQTLTASTDDIADADGLDVSYSHQWLADDADIPGATDSTYTLTDDEVGKAIKVKVSFTDDADNEESLTSTGTAQVTALPNSPATGEPTISGTVQSGETLTASTDDIADADGLTNVSYSHQWLADDADILGATDSSYTLTDDEVGKAIKVKVSFTDDADNEESLTSMATDQVTALPNSPATGAPTISGTAQAGETLTTVTTGIADADGLDNVSYSHQWLADDAEIQNATDSTYTLTDDDVGKAIKVKVSFTDDRNNDETLTSAATGAVAARPDSSDTDAPPGDPSTTVDVTVGDTVKDEIEELHEVDWFRVHLLASESYRIDMRGAWGGEWALVDGEIVWVSAGTLEDPKLLGVYSGANVLVPGTDEEVSGNDRGDYAEGKNSRIESFSPPADGYYYIAAASEEGGWIGTYEITVTVVTEE